MNLKSVQHGVQKCRTCLRRMDNHENKFSVLKISDLLMLCTSIKIVRNDGLPCNICTSCNKKAYQAFQFIKLCEESDKTLRNNCNTILDTQNVKEEEIKDESSDCLLTYETNIKEFDETDGLEEFCDLKNQATSFGDDMDLVEKHDVNEHITALTENIFNCRFCHHSFSVQSDLLKHQIKHQEEIKCGVCEKRFVSMKQLRNHLNIHARKGAHLCQICGKKFTLPENLVRHQRIHNGIRPYKCKICFKSFTQSNELKSHQITHSNEKPYLCSVCGNKYARHISLQIHIRRIHSEASNLRPFACQLCGRTFKDKSDLAQHTLIHKGEKKYVCKICDKAFNRRSNLKVHERIHTGNRPFTCSVCEKTFNQKHVLKTHLKIHSPSH